MVTQNDSISKKKVALGLSGGVDSAVSAYLLKQQGYDVTCVYMQCWDSRADGCRAEEDRRDGVEVAASLALPFLSLDFRDAYKTKVINNFYQEYKGGRTPNPDILCNTEIKFGLFFDWAMSEGFDFVATGHYARIQKDNGTYVLLRGVDETKSQSYFLYTLDQQHLKKIIFPLGEYTKDHIRNIAEEINLPIAKKPDSVGICFIGEVNIKDFLGKELGYSKGQVQNVNGETIGSHDGAWFFTIGQRHGFTIDKYVGRPQYVISKDTKENVIVVGDQSAAKTDEFVVGKLSWVSETTPLDIKDPVVRIRHLGELIEVKRVKKLKHCLNVTLKKKIFGIAPGQHAVFYNEDVVLGGGVILD